MKQDIDYGRSIGAIIGGYLVMAGLATICLLIVSKLFLPAVPVGQMPEPTPTFLLMRMLVNLGTGVVGGYAAAAIAGVYRLAHALILAGIILLIGIAVLVLAPRLFPDVTVALSWQTYLSAVLTPLSVVVGGWLRSRKVVQASGAAQ